MSAGKRSDVTNRNQRPLNGSNNFRLIEDVSNDGFDLCVLRVQVGAPPFPLPPSRAAWLGSFVRRTGAGS